MFWVLTKGKNFYLLFTRIRCGFAYPCYPTRTLVTLMAAEKPGRSYLPVRDLPETLCQFDFSMKSALKIYRLEVTKGERSAASSYK